MAPKKPKPPTAPPARIDPETGLPPVGKGTPRERERVLERARAKHVSRQVRRG